MTEQRCGHVWSEDYVCEICGSIKMAMVPMAVFCAKVRSGPRSVLIALWSFADHGEKTPKPVYPSDRAICERAGGIGKSTLHTHLAWLKNEQLIEVSEDGRRTITLVWPETGGPKIRKECPSIRTGVPNIRKSEDPEGASEYSEHPSEYSEPDGPNIRNHTDQLPSQLPDQDQITLSAGIDAKLTPEQAIEPLEPEASQSALFSLEAPTPPSTPGPKVPKRSSKFALSANMAGLVQRVIDHWNRTKAETAEWAGLTKPTKIEAIDLNARPIAKYIEASGGGEDGVIACCRVIDVQASEARAAGKASTPEAKRALKKHPSWTYWRISTLFGKESNFLSRLDRWQEDGDHLPWGDKPKRDHMIGVNENLRAEAERRLAELGPAATPWESVDAAELESKFG